MPLWTNGRMQQTVLEQSNIQGTHPTGGLVASTSTPFPYRSLENYSNAQQRTNVLEESTSPVLGSKIIPLEQLRMEQAQQKFHELVQLIGTAQAVSPNEVSKARAAMDLACEQFSVFVAKRTLAETVPVMSTAPAVDATQWNLTTLEFHQVLDSVTRDVSS